MSAQKRGLGRGLDALLDPYSESNNHKGVQEVDILLIDTNVQQPRKDFNESSLMELSDSIKIHGIVQPLIVKEKNGRYLIVAGERRYRAARLAKLKTVPVITVDYDDQKMAEVSLIENIQREDLNPIEEASAIRFLMKQHDMTQEEISDRIGKSRPSVANSLRLLMLPESVIEMVKNGSISAGHGRAIAGVNGRELQERLAEETVRLNYSVRALESRIKQVTEKKKRIKKEHHISSDLKQIENQFREKMGTKTLISGTEEKGKIVIEYSSKEQLQRIFECIIEN